MLIFSDEVLAKNLKCPLTTLRRAIKSHPDFPKQKVKGIRSNAYDLDEVRNWWREYSPDAYVDELRNYEVIEQGAFTKILDVSPRLVLHWRKNGLQYKKLKNGIVLIFVDAARNWFLNQNDPRTRAYAEKLPRKGIDQNVSK